MDDGMGEVGVGGRSPKMNTPRNAHTPRNWQRRQSNANKKKKKKKLEEKNLHKHAYFRRGKRDSIVAFTKAAAMISKIQVLGGGEWGVRKVPSERAKRSLARNEATSRSNTRRGYHMCLRTPRRGHHMVELQSFKVCVAMYRFLGAGQNADISLRKRYRTVLCFAG